jgi:hypothetical protein
MGLLSKLTNKGGSPLSKNNGVTPSTPDFSNSNIYGSSMAPSNLDLDGQTPSKYSDSLPE